MPLHRSAVLLCAAVLTAATATALTQGTAAAEPASASITVFLKVPQSAALTRLAGRHDLSRAARLTALRSLVPSAAVHHAVAGDLEANGYRITGQTAWSITATGEQATSARLFGSRPTSLASPALVRRATGALPRVPALLRSHVDAVFPTVGGPSVYHHATSTLDGSAFRNAYTPAHISPASGNDDGAATVATLQLANFYGPDKDFRDSKKAADLSTYASNHGISDPVTGADKRYVAVKVDGGPHGQPLGDPDVEVDLDQQSILSTAPSAHQQAYFAPNTTAGYNDVFAHVYDDVVGNKYATQKNPNIVALSVSWGGCESETQYRSIATLEPILKALTAAGVTIFESAGDAGIYDCIASQAADVDYPGTSPYVVSVGGTHLGAAANEPNTGSNWTETAWTCRSRSSCRGGGGGTGGGRSGEAYQPNNPQGFAGFPAPVYQRAGIDDAPFKNNAKRLVPDIAANGSPVSGFRIYSSNPDVRYESICGCPSPTIGGTSLSAPLSAASLTNALGSRGRFTGIGDVHGALYSAYRNTHTMPNSDSRKAVRDITVGQNGASSDRGSDPSVKATRGFDTVSGVGAVLWPAVMRFVFDDRAPNKPAAQFGEPSAHTGAWRTIRAAWRASRGKDLRLLGSTHVVVQRLGASGKRADIYAYPASGARSFPNAVPGATYSVSVQAQDLGHHRSPVATRTVRVPLDDSRLSHGSAWTRVANRSDIAGAHLATSSRGAALHAGGVGRAYAVRVHVGPNAGRLAITRNGTVVKVINLHAAGAGTRTVEFYSSNTRASRTFTFTDRSGAVSFDALWITY